MKIGVLGMGSIGMRHIKNAESLGHEVARYDPAFQTSKREAVIAWADAIVVASPSQEHVKDLFDALNADKHVLVEKPFCFDKPEDLEWQPVPKNLIIATGYNLRFHSCVKAAKRFIPALGSIQAASFSVLQKTTKQTYLTDGIVRNSLSHEIDLAMHLLDGPLHVVEATVDDQKEAFVHCRSYNTAVYFQADYLTEPQQRYFWIEGEKGLLCCNLELRELYLRKRGEKEIHTIYRGRDSWDQNYVTEMSTFINSIEDRFHLKPLATGEDGINAMKVVMAIREKACL